MQLIFCQQQLCLQFNGEQEQNTETELKNKIADIKQNEASCLKSVAKSHFRKLTNKYMSERGSRRKKANTDGGQQNEKCKYKLLNIKFVWAIKKLCF